jgi:DNA-binding CsgD family transcriptional regulator
MAEVLTERDLRALMAVVEEGRRDEPTEGVPWAVLHGLAGLIHCDRVNFPEADLINGRGLLDQWVGDDGAQGLEFGDDDDPDPAAWWRCVREFLPCSYPQRTGDLASVVRWSDFYTPAELHNTPIFAEFWRSEGVKHGMHMAFPTLPGHFRKISFWRDAGPDFNERDRLVAELLRPHLHEVYLDAQRRRQRVPQLSPREWDVLQLADQGYSNKEIARELFISVATVRKHMEHIFDRTGARTRTAAAALMIPHLPNPHYDTISTQRQASRPRLRCESGDLHVRNPHRT